MLNLKKTILKSQAGISTLEILIALAVLMTSISAVILVSFGAESVSVHAQTSNEALYIAEANLEDVRAEGKKDFNGLNALAGATTTDIYTIQTIVNNITTCITEISSEVTWSVENARPQTTRLSTQIHDPEADQNCITSPPSSAWKNPATFATHDLDPSGSQGTDIALENINGTDYVFITSSHGNPASDDLWIFDLSSGLPVFTASLPITTSPPATDVKGINAIDVAEQKSTGDVYAYIAVESKTDQIQVINVTTPSSPTVVVIISLEDYGVDPAGIEPEGRSMLFYKDRLYVGLHRTAGHELHIFDVSDPTSPIHLGSREVNHNLNEMVVRGDYIYMATSSDDSELTVLDISNPASIFPSFIFGEADPGFDAAGDKDGTSLYLIGNRVYLGRVKSNSEPDLYIIDVTNPLAPLELGGVNLNMGPSSAAVIDIIVLGDLAFLGTSDSNEEFQVWNISNPDDIVNCSKFNFPEEIAGLDFLNDKVYAAVRSNDALHVISDQP